MLKRLFDILFSFTALVFFGWIILICFIVASIDTHRSGFFFQQRIGRYGRPFIIIKIRTMGVGSSGATVISGVGRFFRRSKIDELPQLVNVLLGTMSVVGPRPDVAGYYDVLEGESRRLLELRPGLTGPASFKYFDEEALLGRVPDSQHYNDSVLFPDKVRINLDYYYHRSFWVDLVLVYRTLFRRF